MRLALVGVVVALVVAGCGNSDERRQSVADYIDSVNRVELAMKKPLVALAKNNSSFSTKDIAQTQKRTRAARRTLERLDRRLRALDPPRDARRLHARILALVAAEIDVAREVERLATFLPRLDVALRPVPLAQRRLNSQLRGARTRGAQARALETYADALVQPLADLRALDPPPVSRPVRDGEVDTLVRVSTSATALARALRNGDDAALPALQNRFAAAARAGDTISAQRARIDAVNAYNARVHALGRRAALVQRERDRLQRMQS